MRPLPLRLRLLSASLILVLLPGGASRPADIAFRIHMIDPGFSETVAVADLNNDGKPNIISGESWYEAPNWTKHSLRSIDPTINYIDNLSDLPVDVDGDGWIDIVQVAYYSRNIVWLKTLERVEVRGRLTRSIPGAPTNSPYSPISITMEKPRRYCRHSPG